MPLWNQVLVAVSDDESSLNAVRYVASVLGGSDNCRITILAVLVRNPPGAAELEVANSRDNARARHSLARRLARAREILLETGIPETNLAIDLEETSPGSVVSEVIVKRQQEGGFGTVVLGKRGLSKEEEFLFGSVSSRVMHDVRQCCVWVVS